jgi:predicted small integral membrane protein
MWNDELYRGTYPKTAEKVSASAQLFFRTYPVSILPLVINGGVTVSIFFYLIFVFNWGAYQLHQWILIVLGFSVIYSMSFGLVCCVLLEMTKQVESGEKIKLVRASWKAVSGGFWKASPIFLAWAAVIFCLAIIDALLDIGGISFYIRRSNRARFFNRENNPFSRSELSKLIRTAVFLILPAIVWEGLGFLKACRKGNEALGTIRKHTLMDYETAKIFTAISSVVTLVPVAIYFADLVHSLDLPEPFRYLLLIYMIGMTLALSYKHLSEQIYAAQLYLWYMEWEQQCGNGKPNLPLEMIEPPTFLDNVLSLYKG